MDLRPSFPEVVELLLDTAQKNTRYRVGVTSYNAMVVRSEIQLFGFLPQQALKDEIQARGYVFCELTPA